MVETDGEPTPSQPAGPAPAHLPKWEREAWEDIRKDYPQATDAEIQAALDRY